MLLLATPGDSFYRIKGDTEDFSYCTTHILIRTYIRRSRKWQCENNSM